MIPIRTPPLRERREDIPILAEYFLKRFAGQMGKRVAKVSDAALEILKRYSWPGNVRELENVIERAVALEPSEVVLPERLPDGIRAPSLPAAPVALGSGFDLEEHLRAIEVRLLREALGQAAGDRGRAAEMLGLKPRQLRYLLKKHPGVVDKN